MPGVGGGAQRGALQAELQVQTFGAGDVGDGPLQCPLDPRQTDVEVEGVGGGRHQRRLQAARRAVQLESVAVDVAGGVELDLARGGIGLPDELCDSNVNLPAVLAVAIGDTSRGRPDRQAERLSRLRPGIGLPAVTAIGGGLGIDAYPLEVYVAAGPRARAEGEARSAPRRARSAA